MKDSPMDENANCVVHTVVTKWRIPQPWHIRLLELLRIRDVQYRTETKETPRFAPVVGEGLRLFPGGTEIVSINTEEEETGDDNENATSD